MAANHILYIRNLRPMTSTRFESTKRVDLIGQFVSKAQQIYRGCSSTLKDFESKGWNLEKRLKSHLKNSVRSTEKSHVLMCIIRPCLEQLYAKSYYWKRCTRSTVKPSRFFFCIHLSAIDCGNAEV